MEIYLYKNLRTLRLRDGKSQAQVQRELKLGERVLSHYETGDRDLNSDLISSFAEYYGVTVDELLHVDLAAEDKDKMERLQERFLKKKMPDLILSSPLWKKYQKRIKEDMELYAGHKDDEEWLYNESLEREIERHVDIWDCADEYDLEHFEEMLTKGYYEVFDKAVKLALMYAEAGGEMDFTNGLDATADLFESVMIYGAIAYDSLRREYGFYFDDEG